MANIYQKALQVSVMSLLVLTLASCAPARPYPTPTVNRLQKLDQIKKLESQILDASSAGRLRDAVRLEQNMENEILTAALDEILLYPPGARDGKLLQEMLFRDSRAVNDIAKRIVTGSDAEIAGVAKQMRRDKRNAQLLTGIFSTSSGSGGSDDDEYPGSAGVISLATSVIGAASGNTNRVTRSISDAVNDIDGVLPLLEISGSDDGNADVANRTLEVTTNQINVSNTNTNSNNVNLTSPESSAASVNSEDVVLINNMLRENVNDPMGQEIVLGILYLTNVNAANLVNGTKLVRNSFPLNDKLTDGNSGLIGGVTLSNSIGGLVGGIPIKNDGVPSKTSTSSLKAGSTGLVGGASLSQGTGGLVGGVAIQDAVVTPKPVTSALGDGSTGLVGGVLTDVEIVPVVPGTGIVGGVPVENANSYSASSSKIMASSVSFTTSQPPTFLTPPPIGNGNMFFVMNNGNRPMLAGVIRPAKQVAMPGGGVGGAYGPPPAAPPAGDGADSSGAILGLIAPLSSSLSGSSSGGEGGSDILGALTGLLGPLLAKFSGGEGGSDIFGTLTGLLGPLSSSSSGGNEAPGYARQQAFVRV